MTKSLGVLSPTDLHTTHPKIAELLLAETFTHGVHFEKLNSSAGQALFSLRTNRASRLLATKIHVDGFPFWVILEELPNHEYAKSVVLKAGLKKFLKKYKYTLEEQARAILAARNAEAGASESEASESEEESTPIVHDIECYKEKLIALNPLQQSAIGFQPMVVLGMPGSGKSCVAISELNYYLDNLPEPVEGVPHRLLYVTTSAKLADSMRDSWRNAPEYNPAKADTIEFKSYEEFIRELAPELRDKNAVGEADFSAWLTRFLENTPDKNLKKLLANLDNPSNALYQEFRNISGYAEADYKKLAQSHSLFPNDHTTRGILLSLYRKYQADLEASNQYDLAFYTLRTQPQFAHIVVDEAQDLSTQMLANVKNSAYRNNISYFLDSNQSLFDDLSKMPFLKYLFTHKETHAQDLRTISLSYSIRCPKAVIRMANAVLGLKYALVGGIADKGTDPQIAADDHALEGHVSLLTMGERVEELRVAALGLGCVVITLPEHIREAQEQFPGAIVLTTAQAKGLEYWQVIAYRLLDNKAYTRINDVLSDNSAPQDVQNVGRAKRAMLNHADARFLNELFTAFTRVGGAEYGGSLIFVNEPKHEIRRLIQPLIEAIDNTTAPVILQSPQRTRADWREEMIKQLNQGNLEVAIQINKSHLEMDDTVFAALVSDISASGATILETLSRSSLTSTVDSSSAKLVRQIQYNENFVRDLHFLNDKINYESNFTRLLNKYGWINFLFEMEIVKGEGRCFFEHHASNLNKIFDLIELLRRQYNCSHEILSLIHHYEATETRPEIKPLILVVIATFIEGRQFIVRTILPLGAAAVPIILKPVILEGQITNAYLAMLLNPDRKSRHFLLDAFDENPTLAHSWPARNLWGVSPISIDNEFILENFLTDPCGQYIFNLITDHNPELIQSLSADIPALLCYKNPERMEAIYHFVLLCSTKEGRKILRKFMDVVGAENFALLIRNDIFQFVLNICLERDFEPHRNLKDLSHDYRANIFSIFDDDEDLGMFCSWLQNNRELARAFSDNLISEKFLSRKKYCDLYFLDVLCLSELANSSVFLNLMSRLHPEVFAHAPIEKYGRFSAKFPLGRLLEKSECFEPFLVQFFETNRHLVTPELFESLLVKGKYGQLRFKPVNRLLETDNGVAVLRKLVEISPRVAAEYICPVILPATPNDIQDLPADFIRLCCLNNGKHLIPGLRVKGTAYHERFTRAIELFNGALKAKDISVYETINELRKTTEIDDTMNKLLDAYLEMQKGSSSTTYPDTLFSTHRRDEGGPADEEPENQVPVRGYCNCVIS